MRSSLRAAGSAGAAALAVARCTLTLAGSSSRQATQAMAMTTKMSKARMPWLSSAVLKADWSVGLAGLSPPFMPGIRLSTPRARPSEQDPNLSPAPQRLGQPSRPTTYRL